MCCMCLRGDALLAGSHALKSHTGLNSSGKGTCMCWRGEARGAGEVCWDPFTEQQTQKDQSVTSR
jgi:hypothetical protein